MDVDDLALYTGVNTTRDGFSDVTKWFRRAELYSRAAPYLGYTIDVVVNFDRDVAANSITAYGKTVLSFSQKLDQAVAAGAEYRAISGKVASRSYYQISYSRFITDNDVNSLVCALKSDSNDNIGTTCRFNLDLCSGANKYDVSKLKSIYTIGSRSFVFGAGDNAAMLQTAAGAVPDENFFATLAAAVASETTTGKTIKLCNDCTEVLTVNKSCTIDPNGFAFTGALTPGEGLSVKAVNGVYVFSAPDPADVFVEQVNVQNVVSDEWKTDNGLSADATQEEVQEALKQTDGNGNARWENLVIGQKADEAAAVTAANGGTETTVDVAVTFEVPKDKTGYTVTYAFDKVDISTGDVVENGAGEAKEAPTLDFKEVKANEPTYFKMRAVLEASDDRNVTAEVPVEKTIGVFKVESDAAVTIIPVPWQSLGNGDIKATELVHAASLSEDDELTVYDSKGNSKSWRVNDAGEWIPVPTYEMVENQQTQQVQSQVNDDLKRGQGAILKRSKPKETEIVLIGQAVTSETVETTIAAAGTEPSWNLVASPKMKQVEVGTVAGANTSDEIIVPTAGTPKHYTYKEGKWGYTGKINEKTVRLPNGKTTTAVQFGRKTGDTDVPAGTGFWYLNKDSSNNSKKIAW